MYRQVEQPTRYFSKHKKKVWVMFCDHCGKAIRWSSHPKKHLCGNCYNVWKQKISSIKK